MTVKEIVAKYLKDNGFDGLAGENCGCGLDDFSPCEYPIPEDCVPAMFCACGGCKGANEDCDNRDNFTGGCYQKAKEKQ